MSVWRPIYFLGHNVHILFCANCFIFFILLVSLSVIDENYCPIPFEPVTVSCIVKKTLEEDPFFLSWKCNEHSSTNLVLCNDIVGFTCEFGEVFNVTGTCECNNTVIVSEVTFFANPAGANTLICSNRKEDAMLTLDITGKIKM